MTSNMQNDPPNRPSLDQLISLREAASLQTFRDNYVFYGSNLHIATQIGNAVPVRLAEVLGRTIILCRYGQEVM